MAKKRNTKGAPPSRRTDVSPPALAIWKRPWVWLVGAVAAIALLLSNLTSILSDARKLPGEWDKTSDQFWEWHGEYDAWKGYWTTMPEGIVDVGDLHLSEGEFRLQIEEVADGNFTGLIETAGICGKVPFFDMLMIEGTIDSASQADAKVWDVVGGHRRDFAEIVLERQSDVITVRPKNDPMGIFPASTRIARDPGNAFGEHEQVALCPDKQIQLIQRALEIVEQRNAEAAAADNSETPKNAEQ